MQLTTVILSLFAAAASAAPTSGSCQPPTRKFGIMALRSASPIHFARAGASQNKMALNLPESRLDAQCADGQPRAEAIFYIKDGELYLYGNEDNVQQFLVDRSGMGQGVLQYFTRGETAPGGRLEVKGWAVDENDNLTFNGSGFLACPSTTDSSWNVWVSAGVDKPAGQEGCLGFTARTVTVADPVKCTYSNFA
ncbi:Cell wall protein PhiA [Madurella fahalii]|uniref:Cell wall protein PhiA n=1 Tax=Madurella fahalii TaxID=1157608 RepID=A0ABQ0GJS8_9PEZI